MYYVYMLRCEDGSVYTGYTTDPGKRFCAHSGTLKNGAKYTRSRRPVCFEAVWETENKSDALRLEAAIKKLRRADKLLLISGGDLPCDTGTFTRRNEFENTNFTEVKNEP